VKAPTIPKLAALGATRLTTHSKKKSDDAACRCNPEKYKWGTHVKNPKKCNN
jgi:hypothetical protein